MAVRSRLQATGATLYPAAIASDFGSEISLISWVHGEALRRERSLQGTGRSGTRESESCNVPRLSATYPREPEPAQDKPA